MAFNRIANSGSAEVRSTSSEHAVDIVDGECPARQAVSCAGCCQIHL
jgi:hypothetical protein